MQYISLNKNYGLIFYMLHPLIQEVFFLIKKKKKWDTFTLGLFEWFKYKLYPNFVCLKV